MIYEINSNKSINKTIELMNEKDILILNDGIYNEKVYLIKNNITIKAKNSNKVIIQNNDYYHKIMDNNNECNTFGTYTFYVGGNNVVLEGLHIKNLSTPSNIYGQAVALHVDGNHFKCIDCTIESAQDTLFTGPLPSDLQIRYKDFHNINILKPNHSKQLYYMCNIIGDIDFIFGCATVLFHKCFIKSINTNPKSSAYISAPAHDINTPYGYLFLECNIVCEKETYLARPWRDYGCAAFINNNYEGEIYAEGFDKWNGSNRDKTARFYEYAKGIDITKRVTWSHQLTDIESEKYTNKFMDFIEYNSWAK